MHICMKSPCWVHLVLLLCTRFQGWPLSVRYPIRGIIPEDDYLPLSSCWADCGPLCREEHCDISTFHNSISIGTVIAQTSFRWPYYWDIMGVAFSSFLENTIIQQGFLVLCLLESLHPLFHSVLWKSGIGIVDVSKISCSLNFDKL